MSFSRVHCTLTGALQFSARAADTASTITSASETARRPKPPPVFITCSRTLSGGTPATWDATAW